MKKLLTAFFLMLPSLASAQIIPTLPVTLTNGTLADANQVMSNFNTIVTGVNTNGAKNGTNSDITALNALATPITPVQGGSSVYTGNDTGSANAYVVATATPTGFTLRGGNTVTFLPLATNTSTSTLSTGGTAATAILKQTSNGLVVLTGGEIVAGQIAQVVFDGLEYELLNSAVSSNVIPCTSIDYTGVTAPVGYLSENGQAVSRTAFVNLLNCLAFPAVSATLASSTTITVPNSALFQVGWFVGGSNVTCNSTITSIPGGGTTIVINNAAGATGASTLTIGPFPQGDCATTFNVPNYQGRATVMADTAGSTLTAAACPNPNVLGTSCGSTTQTILATNEPFFRPTITSAATTGGGAVLGVASGSAPSGAQAGVGSPGFFATNAFGTITVTSISTTNGGASTPLLLQPIGLVTKAIKF
jgi:hypothetical protein